MKRVLPFAAAAAILAVLGIVSTQFAIRGRSSGIAFGAVAKALDRLRSATYDVTSEAKGENGQPPATATGKGFFLAPSHQRMEVSVELSNSPAVKAAEHAAARRGDNPAAKAAAKEVIEALKHMEMPKMHTITIADGRAGKSIMLMPDSKVAVEMDMKKIRETLKASGKGPPPDLFDLVRRLVREGSGGTAEKVKKLGSKEIDGRESVGFQTRAEMGNMTVWADPETARPIRIELTNEMLAGVHMTMNNFRYDIDLDPSLFSLEPPEGYVTQTSVVRMPTEEDLLRTLRAIAEHNKGLFPTRLVMDEEVMRALTAAAGPPAQAMMTPEMQAEMEAAMEKVAAKYGGKEKMRAKYGRQLPPEIMAEFTAEFMKATAPLRQKQVQESMKSGMPLVQKLTQGITFYNMLGPENDAYYVGGGVKLGTPDRPILWYKPTGAEKYRVLYADLSVKEMTPEEIKSLPEAKVP